VSRIVSVKFDAEAQPETPVPVAEQVLDTPAPVSVSPVLVAEDGELVLVK
jgi:hypothetical protein